MFANSVRKQAQILAERAAAQYRPVLLDGQVFHVGDKVGAVAAHIGGQFRLSSCHVFSF